MLIMADFIPFAALKADKGRVAQYHKRQCKWIKIKWQKQKKEKKNKN